MKNKKQTLLYTAQDYLVTAEFFDVYWDEQKKRAWTDMGSVETLDRYYDSRQYVSHQTEDKSFFVKAYSQARALMLRYKFQLFNSLVKPYGKLLDIGCGTGDFLAFMENKSYQVFGVENNKNAAATCAKKGLKVFKALDKVSEKGFDMISLWHVLEHLPNPEDVVAKGYSLLSERGILVVAVPNFDSHDRRYYKHDWAALDVPRHLWHFTAKGLEEMLAKAGFELVKKRPMWLDVFYISYLSESNRGEKFAFLTGVLKAGFFTLRSIFSNNHSSMAFIFRKSPV